MLITAKRKSLVDAILDPAYVNGNVYSKLHEEVPKKLTTEEIKGLESLQEFSGSRYLNPHVRPIERKDHA